jgi:hypothetical protein
MDTLIWSKSEKQIAKQAFNQIYKHECDTLMQQIREQFINNSKFKIKDIFTRGDLNPKLFEMWRIKLWLSDAETEGYRSISTTIFHVKILIDDKNIIFMQSK